MNVIAWIGMSEETRGIKLRDAVVNGTVTIDEWDYLETKDVVEAIKTSLMGEYHIIFIRAKEDRIIDSEVYLLTFDEVVEGGDVKKLDWGIFLALMKGEGFK